MHRFHTQCIDLAASHGFIAVRRLTVVLTALVVTQRIDCSVQCIDWCHSTHCAAWSIDCGHKCGTCNHSHSMSREAGLNHNGSCPCALLRTWSEANFTVCHSATSMLKIGLLQRQALQRQLRNFFKKSRHSLQRLPEACSRYPIGSKCHSFCIGTHP